MPKRKAIVVLGMHRAGTSLLMHALERCGVRLGAGLMPADEWNVEGYREIEAIYRAQEAVLEFLERPWTQPSGVMAFPRNWWTLPELEPSRRRLEEVVRTETSAAGIWAFKDPRTATLLPLWQQIFDEQHIEPIYLLAVRHPEAVAASLERRNGFPRPHSYLLWMKTYLDAVRGTGGKIAAVLHHERWFTDPATQVDALLTALEAAGVGDAVEPRQIESVARRELLHHQIDPTTVGETPASELYRELCADRVDPTIGERWAERAAELCTGWLEGRWGDRFHAINASRDAEVWTVAMGGASSRCLFIQPPVRHEFRIPDAAPGFLDFALTLHPSVWERTDSGGCQIEIEIDRRVRLMAVLDPVNIPEDRRWHEFRLAVPVGEGGGHQIEIVTRTLGDSKDYRWALCREPVFTRAPDGQPCRPAATVMGDGAARAT